MVKFVLGILLFVFGLILLGWVGYNLLIERQKEFQMNVLGFGFMGGLFFVGGKWIGEGWQTVGPMLAPRKRSKKKKKVGRRVSRDEDS